MPKLLLDDSNIIIIAWFGFVIFSSASDKEDDSTAELRGCIRVLADKVGSLSKHRADLLDRYSKAEAANDQLTKELEEKKELVNTLYMKHQSEKQVICMVYKSLF